MKHKLNLDLPAECQEVGGAKSDLKAAMRALEISTASKADTIAAYRAQLADNPEQQAVDRLEQQIQALREVCLPLPSIAVTWLTLLPCQSVFQAPSSSFAYVLSKNIDNFPFCQILLSLSVQSTQSEIGP